MKLRSCFLVFFLVLALGGTRTKSKKAKEKPDWAKKKIADYNDADLQRLYDQWEEDDDPIPVDELPDHDPRKPRPSVDFSKLDMSDPESVIRATKKGQTLMMFVKVSDNPSREETEQITSIWQTGLWNSHMQTDRFLLEDDRVIFMFKDGDQAFEAKNYLVEQERCEDVQLEQKTYCGRYSRTCEQEQEGKEKEEQKEKKKKKKKKKSKNKDEL